MERPALFIDFHLPIAHFLCTFLISIFILIYHLICFLPAVCVGVIGFGEEEVAYRCPSACYDSTIPWVISVSHRGHV